MKIRIGLMTLVLTLGFVGCTPSQQTTDTTAPGPACPQGCMDKINDIDARLKTAETGIASAKANVIVGSLAFSTPAANTYKCEPMSGSGWKVLTGPAAPQAGCVVAFDGNPGVLIASVTGPEGVSAVLTKIGDNTWVMRTNVGFPNMKGPATISFAKIGY